jgi:competence protein ComEA
VPATAPAAPAAAKAATPAAKGKAEKSKLAPGEKININTATEEELDKLPEIGPVKAKAIIAGRPYKTPEDIMKVRGIKEGIYNKIKDNITVH